MMVTDSLYRIRKEQGKKQIDIANAIGVSDVTFSHYESGKIKPNIDRFEKWLDALGYEMKIVSKQEEL